MKECKVLRDWRVRRLDESELCAGKLRDVTAACEASGQWYDSPEARSAQEILLEQGVIDAKVLLGHTEDCAWIGESDWLYACDFTAEPGAAPRYISCGGIDTIADVYLNGEPLCQCDDMFYPMRERVTGRLKHQNRLAIHFKPPRRAMDEARATFPEEYRGDIAEYSILRKSPLDYLDFGRVTLVKIGLFADVCLETIDSAELVWPDIEVTLGEWYHWADISVRAECRGSVNGSVRVEVFSPVGEPCGTAEVCVDADGEFEAKARVRIEKPRLWWPLPYTEHPRYRVSIAILDATGRVLDEAERRVGIRRLERTGDMRWRVNGREIKLWGANFEPFWGFSQRWEAQRERAIYQLKLAADAHMNCIRLWGGAVPLDNEFYEWADELGILLWQEFFLWWGYYPETQRYRENYRLEAEYHVKRLKHYACVMLWCAGNEILFHNEEAHWPKDRKEVSYCIFREDYAQVCKKLDPGRVYLPTSPSGGDYPGDPRQGDCHPLYYSYRHAVKDYPLFTAESARSSIGPLRSLRRWMTDEEIWPKGYVNQLTANTPNYHGAEYVDPKDPLMVTAWKNVPLPDTWWKHACSYFGSECASLEHFFDAHDAESLVYRVNAAFAEFTQDYAERARVGKPYYDMNGVREVNGYLIWKINDMWPQFYCTLVDYFLETHIPFYQVKRSYSPLLLSFDFQNHIYLWGVNDTPDDVEGRLTVKRFSPAFNRVMREIDIPVSIRRGESKVLTDLDELCPIVTEEMLYASLRADDGRELGRATRLMDIERNQTFQHAQIALKAGKGELIVTTDRAAHCVELTGDENGDEFGWYFEDNYFDLLPFEEKHIRLYTEHKGGVIRAKAHYSPYVSQCDAISAITGKL